MMHLRTAWSVSVMMAALATAACDEAVSVDEALAGLDATDITAAMEDISSTIDASNDALASWADAMFALSEYGTSFSSNSAVNRVRRDHPEIPASGVTFRTLVEIPTEIMGKTFVYDPVEQAWVTDEDATGAPSNGVRIVYYETDASGSIVQPLNPLGRVDLTDEDDTALPNKLGVLIVRSADNATLADYYRGSSETESATGYQEHYEAAGFFGDGTNQVDFSVSGDDSYDSTAGDSQSSFSMLFSDASRSFSWESTGTENGATGDYDEDFTINVTRDGVTTALSLEASGDYQNGDGDLIGTLSHDGILIANVTLTAGFEFSKPDGGSFTAEQESTLQTIVEGMFATAFLLLFIFLF